MYIFLTVRLMCLCTYVQRFPHIKTCVSIYICTTFSSHDLCVYVHMYNVFLTLRLVSMYIVQRFLHIQISVLWYDLLHNVFLTFKFECQCTKIYMFFTFKFQCYCINVPFPEIHISMSLLFITKNIELYSK